MYVKVRPLQQVSGRMQNKGKHGERLIKYSYD